MRKTLNKNPKQDFKRIKSRKEEKMQIITISREFGSGGRELGKRIADILGIAYYDREILASIAQDSSLDEAYVERALLNQPFRAYPITIGRTFSFPSLIQKNETDMLVAQQRVIKRLAGQSDCVVMGRGADQILREYQPLNLFVYAEMDAKMRRCRERAPKEENLTDNELRKKIRQVDAGRAKRYQLINSTEWGRKENYHLCINTTGLDIKALSPQIAEYAKFWFGAKQS